MRRLTACCPIFSGAVLTTLPVLLVFVVLQRHYMQGVMLGSLKE